MATHTVAFHTMNASVFGISLLPLLVPSNITYASAFAGLVYYIILIWKEGVVQAGWRKIRGLFKRHR